MNEVRFLSTETEKKRIKEKIKEYLESQPEISFGYFLGSFLSDGSYADVDIGVFFRPEVAKDDYLDLVLKYSSEISILVEVPVEVHSINDANLEFQFQSTKGELIFSHDEEERYNFLEEVWPRYFDFQYFIHENLNDLLKL